MRRQAGLRKLGVRPFAAALSGEFSLMPSGIMRTLDLLRQIHFQTVADGHSRRDDIALPWAALY